MAEFLRQACKITRGRLRRSSHRLFRLGRDDADSTMLCCVDDLEKVMNVVVVVAMMMVMMVMIHNAAW